MAKAKGLELKSPRRSGTGITRIDQDDKYTHGWWVRRVRNKKRLSKFFSDREYGGSKESKKAAEKHSEELRKQLWDK